jgi:glutamate-1-semialdehyde 2,1-aminomutase
MKFDQSDILQPKIHSLIPGGCHTYAKGDDQFPESYHPYIINGKGCHVWDTDGNEFIEYGMGLRSVTLGHAFDPVTEAVCKQIKQGTNFCRPTVIEAECAEQLLGLLPHADMVKFAKNGSDVTTAAVRLARAYTKRNLVAVCAEQPFFSFDDWFIGSTSLFAGIPQVIRDLTVKFHYNDIDSVKKLFEQYPDQIACVILEAEKETAPQKDFLQEIRRLTTKNGALLILDEIITGFRWHLNGAQHYYNIAPDLSAFGKALGNGFSIAALAGKREMMELGGIQNKNKNSVFLLSATNGAETHSLAAAMATMTFYQEHKVIGQLHAQGEKLRAGINRAIDELRLESYFKILGKPCCLIYQTCDHNAVPSQLFRTLFLQETIKRGLIAPSLVVSFSHTEEVINETIDIVYEALLVYRKALNEGIEKYLVGRPVQPVFK